ncbi:unnamed protein product [Phyllotreta striolata]|uniref:Chitin-binding type-2 domain-containing protein n=1 Tax=Phyllotreta striolata TaxID=444603 RepID=A0A9N9TM78_PHYSR|nr:unnamed protein product [Phyllotreta striolata]
MRGVVLIICLFRIASIAHGRSSNGYLLRGSRSLTPKDINQWNIVQGAQQCTDQPASPGFVWIQVPVGNVAVLGGSQQSQKQTESQTTASGPSTPIAPSSNPSQQSTATAASSTTGAQSNGNSDLKNLCLKPRGQFPGTTCKTYVNCWDGAAVEQECPEGLLFSSKGYCDFSQNVVCKTEKISKISPQELKECPFESGTFRDKNDCSVYHKCIAYKITATYICPVGFKYNEEKGICDYEEKVNCNKTQTINGNVEGDAIAAQFAQCPVKYGTYRDPNNCSKYYVCALFKIIAQRECPSGLSFNDNTGACDYSYNVNCNEKPKMYEITADSIHNLPSDYQKQVNNCKPGLVFRLNPQCSIACLCREELAEIVRCPNGFAYDSKTDKCVLAHLANC